MLPRALRRRGVAGNVLTSPWVLAPALAALAAYAASALSSDRLQRLAQAALWIAWGAHALTIAADVSRLGDPGAGARFGFAPAMSMTLWLVIGVYMLESRWVPIARIRRSMAVAGALTLVALIVFPGESFGEHPRWAPLHWLTGIASYGLFGVAVVHAAMLGAADRRMRAGAAIVDSGAPQVPLLRLERLTFLFVRAGFIALSATLLLGWTTAGIWRWDHKTVFSVLAWVVFAFLLGGRAVFGWRGRMAVRWVYTGAVLLLLAYVGSRFVLEVLLQRPLPG